MKIIISPAKKMQESTDFMEVAAMPVFWQEAECILQKLRSYF